MVKRKIKQALNVEHDLYDKACYKQMVTSSSALQEITRKGKAELQIFPELLQDTFFSFFKHSVRFKDPNDVLPIYQFNRNLLQKIMATTEFKQLRAYTRLDEIQAATASASLGDQVLKENSDEILKINQYIKDLQKHSSNFKKLQKEIKKYEKQLKVKNITPNEQRQLLNALNQLKNKQNQINQSNQQVQNNLNTCFNNVCGGTFFKKALDNTLKTVQLQEHFFGWGTGTGSNSPGDYKDRLALANQILTNKNLLKIARLAGKFRRIATKKQKQKTKHAFDEISDIRQSDDIARLIPSETFLLVEPELEYLFYKKFTDKELLTYKLTGEEPKGKGPIIICTDVSGSMSGDPDVWCKASALALIQIAHKEKRNAIVIPFDTRVQSTFEFYKNSFSYQTLLEMASFFSGGGTNFNPPIQESMKYLEKESELKNGDIIFITDGEGSFSNQTKVAFLELKEKLKFSMYTIVIGSEYGFIQHSLKPISDRLIPVETLTDDLAAEIFETV